MVALFTPLPRDRAAAAAWLGVALALVYTAYSVATINHNAWGAELRPTRSQRTRITAIREGLALHRRGRWRAWRRRCSAPPPAPTTGLARFAIAFAVFTLAACVAVTLRAPSRRAAAEATSSRCAGVAAAARRPAVPPAAGGVRRQRHRVGDSRDAGAVLHRRRAAGGSAAGPVPRALLRRRRRRHAAVGPAVRAPAARRARGWPAWSRPSSPSSGRARSGPGDAVAFAAICVLSGARARRRPRAAAVAAGRRHRSRRTRAGPPARYFGLWTLATKLNLALAAGIALPLLGAPGLRARRATGAAALACARLRLRGRALRC